MTWYFCYYVTAKYGQTYFNPEECLHTDILAESCDHVTVHMGTQHKIHEVGMNLKMYGLGSAIIIETNNEKDVTVLKLVGNAIINESKFRPNQRPTLQLIVFSPNFPKLDAICQDLEIARHHQQCSREDMEETIRIIQRQADKLVRLVDDLHEQVSDTFKTRTSDFVESCVDEINRHTDHHRETARATAGIRKQLLKAFSPFVIYANPDGGFK